MVSLCIHVVTAIIICNGKHFYMIVFTIDLYFHEVLRKLQSGRCIRICVLGASVSAGYNIGVFFMELSTFHSVRDQTMRGISGSLFGSMQNIHAMASIHHTSLPLAA